MEAEEKKSKKGYVLGEAIRDKRTGQRCLWMRLDVSG